VSTTTTELKPLPSHYQAIVDKAMQMGWQVRRSDGSVKIVSPSGRKGSEIVLSLKTPLPQPQLTKLLQQRGFLAVVQAWEREQKTAGKQGEEKPTAPEGKDVKLLVCPECQDSGTKEPYTSTRVQSLATHRRQAHKVVGNSQEAVRRREKLAEAAAKTKAVKKAPAKKMTEPVKKTPASPALPAPRAADPAETKGQEPLVNVSGLPVSVTAPLGEMLTSLQAELHKASDLHKEVQPLRDFFDKVDDLVHDGNKAPVQVVASILTLVEETKQK
jgi:hypothetical protein